MTALLDASGTENESAYWREEPGSYRQAVNQIATFIQSPDLEAQHTKIDEILGNLEQTFADVEVREENSPPRIAPRIALSPGDPYKYPMRRILCAVLAELSERLTYRAFIHTRALATVVTLLARAARDKADFHVRRFAIRTLGNLQQFTDEVAEAFFEACRDTEVYGETRTAVSKFKVFGPGSLERLTTAIRSPSITVAYHAALLLGELGISRSDDLDREGRTRVADELVRLLNDPLAERMVYDFSKNENGTRVGPLYDVIHEALIRVVAGSDAPTRPVGLAEGIV